MAKVDISGFGNRVAGGPEGAPAVRDAFVQKGIDQFGETLDKTANSAASEVITERNRKEAEARAEQARLAAEARQLEHQQKVTAAFSATTKYSNFAADIHDGLKNDLETGNIQPDVVVQRYNEQAGKEMEKQLQGLAPEVSGHARVMMENTLADTRRKIDGSIVNYQRSQMVADFGVAEAELMKASVRDPEDAQAKYTIMARDMLTTAGVPPAKIEAHIQDFKQRSQFLFENTLMHRAWDNPEALENLRRSLDNPQRSPDLGSPPDMAALTKAIVGVEGGTAGQMNSAGIAKGTRQMTKAAWQDYGVQGVPFEKATEEQLVAASDRKIADDYAFFKGDPAKVAAAYIGGRGAVKADGTINDTVKDAYGTTPAAYAKRVLERMQGAATTPREVLDPSKKEILLNGIDRRLEQLRLRNERQQATVLRKVNGDLTSAENLSNVGVDLSATAWDQLRASTKGTELEDRFNEVYAQANDNIVFSRLPPREMAQQIEADTAALTAGMSDTREGAAVVRRLGARVKTYNAAITQLTNDPLAYNARTAGTDIPAIDPKNPQSIPAALRARADILLPLNATHGAGLGLLRPDEAKAFQQILRSQDAGTRAATLGMIYTSVRDKPPQVFNATLAQIAPDSPVTAFAGHAIAAGDVNIPRFFGADLHIQSAELATRLLRGESMLNPPPGAKADDGKPHRGVMSIKENDFELQFNGLAQNTFSGPGAAGVRNTYYQAARAVYADLSADAGDFKGDVNATRARKAWEMVTGGGSVDFNGSRVLAPLGMGADGLKPAVYAEFSRLRAAGRTNLPAEAIQSAQLRQLEPGVYALVAGGRMLPDDKAAGEPLLIDLTNPSTAPVQTTARRPKK